MVTDSHLLVCYVILFFQNDTFLVFLVFYFSEEREEKITSWLKALVEKSSQFEDGEPNSSYGETLLLIAIHFHSHSLEPIVELISSTLGIKLKPSSLTKVKIVFTQQVFQEKVYISLKPHKVGIFKAFCLKCEKRFFHFSYLGSCRACTDSTSNKKSQQT